jgi:NhaP-type Na+/H+ or K+/H+ antiporter
LVAISYGTAQLCLASGFLAVFAAGLALNRVREQPLENELPPEAAAPPVQGYGARSTHPCHASATMTQAVQVFNGRLEKLAELAIVLIIGAMLPYVQLSPVLWWFIPLLFLILRPLAVLAVLAGMLGMPLPGHQRAMIGWFGIRGIGSVFYLMFALHHGVTGELARDLVSLTLVTVAASILAHGMSVLPAMTWYARCKAVRL